MSNIPFIPQRWIALAVFGAILVALPFVFSNKFQLSILILVGLNAMLCLGLNLLVGTAGQISLGHAAFYGIGAYASAILTGDYGWNAFAAIAAGIAASGAIAAVVGRPIFRLQGHYLAMATLGVGLVIYLVLVHENGLTGGPDGRAVKPLTVFGEPVRGELSWYWIIAAVLFFAVWAAENLTHSPWGRSLRAIHASEPAAAAVGIDVRSVKVVLFVASAALASLAGSLFAHAYGFITPDRAGFLHSVELVVMIVLGGLGSIYGGIAGAAIIGVLPHVLTAFKDYENLAYGLLLILVPYFFREGLIPMLAGLARLRR